MKPPKMPEPPGAYGPTQYPFIGMNCSFWADAMVVAPNSARPSRAALLNLMMLLLGKTPLTEFESNSIGQRGFTVNGETAIAAAFPCRSARVARAHAARRPGRR